MLTTILGLVAASHPGLRHSVDNDVAGQFPLIGKQLTGNIGALKRSSVIGLIVGLLLAIWGTAGLAQSAMFAMAQVWNVPGPQRPGYLQRLGRSGLFLLGLLIGVVATTGLASLSTIGNQNPGIAKGCLPGTWCLAPSSRASAGLCCRPPALSSSSTT